MNDLQVFKNEEFGEVRTIDDNGKILFCGSDVAKALGYAIPSKAVNAHCKGVSKMEVPTRGGIQQMLFIPEGDLYRLITHSRLKEAEKFERWVFDDVLPSIRKHGAYMTPETIERVLLNPDTIIQLAQSLKEERQKNEQLSLENIQQRQIIGELKPKATYYDVILNNKGLVTITQIAKDYGMSGRALNKKLHELGVQYKQSDQWLLYREYHDKGYTHSQTQEIVLKDGTKDIKMNTKWTQKGRLFLYELLKYEGILPTIEREKVA